MRFTRTFLFLLVLLVISVSLLAQQTTTTLQRDPQALAILSQVLSAAGGANALTAIQDFTASGQVTFYWAGEAVQGSVTVQCRGLNQFRLEATLPDGVHSWIVSKGSALEKHPDGSMTPMPFENTLKPASITLPLTQLAAALQDASMSITYIGLVTHDGQQAHDIRLQKVLPATSDPYGVQSKITRADFFIDPNTFSILSVQDMAYRRDNEPGESPHEMQFSDNQSTSGILVPFSITELIGGQQTVSIQLSQITFNSGLTDADFTF